MPETKDFKDSPPGTLPTRLEKPARPRSSHPGGELWSFSPGSTLGNYRIVRHLGSGGMGSVYEATHLELGKKVALKVLIAELAADEHARARFLREAEAASKMDHPNVVKVTDFGVHDTLPFLVMQLLRGEDVAGRLAGNLHGLPVAEVADIFLGVCAGVFAAHRLGIIHRDLKPRNIFLARMPDGEVEPKVLDFGVSKVQDSAVDLSLTAPGTLIGTTTYLSPEQAGAGEASALSDQYALGVCLYECLTAQQPFEGGTKEALLNSIRGGKFPRPSRWRPDLPPELETIVLRAMAREPAARFDGVHAVGAALVPLASPKKRLAWTDYYARVAPDPAGARQMEPPDRRPVTRSLVKMATPRPVPAESGAPAILAQPSRWAPTQPIASRGSPPPDMRTRESPMKRKHRSGWTLAVLAAVALIAGIILVAGTFRQSVPREPVAPAVVPNATPSPASFRPAGQVSDGPQIPELNTERQTLTPPLEARPAFPQQSSVPGAEATARPAENAARRRGRPDPERRSKQAASPPRPKLQPPVLKL